MQENVPLGSYSTMGLGGTASYLTEIATRQELLEAYTWAKKQNLPVIVIGGGSNIVWKDGAFSGLIIVNKILSYEVQELGEENVFITIGAGENWDSVVARTVEAGLTGIEALSLVPGSAGATPIQNVGAYGQEISQTLATVEAYDTKEEKFVTLAGIDCEFSYRNSRFKSKDRGRFFITSLTLQLSKGNPLPPFYGSVQSYFDEHGITEPTPKLLRQAVIDIRTAKLPDPATVKNTGSFFANPVIEASKFNDINDPENPIPSWPTSNGKIKLSAAWLIEQAGFKAYHDEETGMSTWPKQALVLVNEKARSTQDLLNFKQKIVAAVEAKFGITLVQEPELLP